MYGFQTGQVSDVFCLSRPLSLENKGVATSSIQLDSKNPILYIYHIIKFLFFSIYANNAK